MEEFAKTLMPPFELRNAVTKVLLKSNACEIPQETDCAMEIDLTWYLSKFELLPTDSIGKDSNSSQVTHEELKLYQKIPGEIFSTGTGTISQQSLIDSVMLQPMPTLKVEDLIDEQQLLRKSNISIFCSSCGKLENYLMSCSKYALTQLLIDIHCSNTNGAEKNRSGYP